MSISIPHFWQLLAESRLLAPEQCQQLAADFTRVKGAGEQGNAKVLAEWLVTRNVLSKYQTANLLAGRNGPFVYGDYKVYDRVDKGRLAGAFRAVHGPTGHPVLLHFLTGAALTDPQLWTIVSQNTLIASAIVSPHVQRFFEPVDLRNFRFLVSEDLRGSTLEDRLAVGRFPPAEACRIARLAALGLAQMHQCGRAHGDLRPANMLLESIPNHPGNVKLLLDAGQTPLPVDFSRQEPGSPLALMADYLAPELASPGRPPDPLGDLYALGCTLYAMLAGSPPFASGNLQQTLARHASEAIRPLEQFGAPQPLAQLVAYLMAKNPGVRYQSAAIVADQLAPFVDPGVLYVQPPAPPPTAAGYEGFVRQRLAQFVAAAPSVSPHTSALAGPPAAMPPGPLDVGFQLRKGPAYSPERERLAGLGAMASAPMPTQGAAPAGVQIGIGPGKSAAPKQNAALIAQRLAKKNADQQRMLMLGGGIASAAVLLIGAIVAINMMGRDDKPEDVAVVDPTKGGTGEQPGTSNVAVKNTNTAVPVTPGTPGTATPGAGTPGTSSPGSGVPATVTPTIVGTDGFQQEIVTDDGNTLWASPTTGKPVSFRCVPPEGQLFLMLRPADLVAGGEGERVLQALGPTVAAQRETLETAAGLKFNEIEQLIITLHTNGGQFPRASFVVKTKLPLVPEEMLAKWGNPVTEQVGTATYYNGANWSFYIANSPDAERTFLIGETKDVAEVAKTGGAPPVLFREVERLRRATDADRHFTLLVNPEFLAGADGAPLFAAERAKVRQPLAWFLGDGLRAVSASAHFGPEFYFELRMFGTIDKEPYKIAEEVRSRLTQVPSSLEDYFVAMTPPTYWKKLAMRYPSMVNQLHANMRIGVENEQAVVNAFLPGAAAHNLVLGGELMISSAPGTAAVAAVGPAPAAGAATPKTIEEALQTKTSYSFDQQSLEFAMRDLAEDVKGNTAGAPFEFAIKILGDDLKIDGITRNQSVRDFKQENQTVADILTALVRKANPVTTVKDPSETDQKLVWLIGADPENPNKQIILITTRAAAATKKWTLPPVFRPKAN